VSNQAEWQKWQKHNRTFFPESGVPIRTANGQEVALATSEAIADRILADHTAARVGREALEKIKDLGWQEGYIGPWVQEEAYCIAAAALDAMSPTGGKE
jgi:hypothetical protein